MSRILLADDSSHAQRMGERILSAEGYEVVTVSDGESALIRLLDVDPDVVIADAVMPLRSGYELCQFVKLSPLHRHVRVVLTAGAMEPLDEAQATRVGADSTLRKPFEATALLEIVERLAGDAYLARRKSALAGTKLESPPAARPAPAPFVAVLDREMVRAAVTVALDAAMPALVEEVSARLLASLATKPAVPPSEEAGLIDMPDPAPAAPPEIPTDAPVPLKHARARLFSKFSILGLETENAGSTD